MKKETREWIEGIKVYLEMQKKLKAGIVKLRDMYVSNYPDEGARKVHVYQDIEKLAEELGIIELEVERDEDDYSQEVSFMFEGLMFFQLLYTLPRGKKSTISLEEFRSAMED